MFSVFAGAVLLAVGLGFASSPHGKAAVPKVGHDDQMMRAYAEIWSGMPISQIDALGFNIAAAERLPKSVLMARFMPSDAAEFNALDPAIKDCYRGPGDCTAYIFDVYTGFVLVLVQDGRVTWKWNYNSVVAGTAFSQPVA
jgi:hypothetical protein